MIVGILSDTHDNLKALAAALAIFKREEVSYIIHAGDWVSPFTVELLKKEGLPFFGVFGNNDGDKILLNRFSEGNIQRPGSSFELDGWKILVLHEPDNIEALASSGFFNLIVHGHDHRSNISEINGTIVINPGEAGGWVTGKSTVATLDMKTGQAGIHDLII